MLKVGIIGCGNIFTMHATSANHLENSKIVAVCDVKEERADKGGELNLGLEPPKTPVKSAPPERNIIPPSIEAVRSYCLQRRNNVNPEHFMNYWESRGWMMRPGIKMKDWQAAVRTFEANEPKSGAQSAKKPDGWRKPERSQFDGLEGV